MASGISSERGLCKHTDIETEEVCLCLKLIPSKSEGKLLCGGCGHHASFHLPGYAIESGPGKCLEKSDSGCEDGCQEFFPPHDSLLSKNCGGCGCHRDDHLSEGEKPNCRSTGDGSDAVDRDDGLDPKHKIFLSFNGAQRGFSKKLYEKLVSSDRFPFYDRQRSCLPLGENAPDLMWDAIKQCRVGVMILSEEYFTRTKWPMLEFVRMTRELKRNDNPIIIIPVFLGISHVDCRDRTKHEQWSKIWEKWASAENNRVYNIDVTEWVQSVQEFFDRPVQRLELRSKGQQGAFREEIVDAIRREVRPELAFSCAVVQGRKRLYEEFRKRIFSEAEGENANSKVRVVGLYGVGGVGKTTLCKVLHYELSPEFRDKVCHVDLGKTSTEKVYRKVTREFVELEPRELDNLKNSGDSAQFVRLLNSDKLGKRVFLAIDDVTDEQEKVVLVKQLMNVKWRDGSVVLVTSRSKDILNRIGIDRSFGMLDLEEGEARALFLKSVRSIESRVNVDVDLIKQCLNRCYFSKGVVKNDRHWHPLALKVLGTQLMFTFGYDPGRWKRQLESIDTFNATHSTSDKHPVFSILRSSFDALKGDEKLLFMNVALFMRVPDLYHRPGMMVYESWSRYFANFGKISDVSVIDWLCMVHDNEGDELENMLDSLKRKSVLESVNEYLGGYIHDLWLEFALEETKQGNIARIYETTLKVSKGDNIRSMRLEAQVTKTLENVDLSGFPMLSVLSVSGFQSNIQLDVSKLSLLKSLEVTDYKTDGVDIKGLGALKSLAFLRVWGIGNPACLQEIKDLTNLQILDLGVFEGDKLPDLRKLTKLRVLNLRGSRNLESIELRNLSNLRVLDVGCGMLRRLDLFEWTSLTTVLDDVSCGNLRRLDLFECTSLTTVLDIGRNSKTLQELRVSSCPKLEKLPGLHYLDELTVLHISACPFTERLPNLKELEELKKLKKLEDLDIDGCKSMEDLLKKTS